MNRAEYAVINPFARMGTMSNHGDLIFNETLQQISSTQRNDLQKALTVVRNNEVGPSTTGFYAIIMDNSMHIVHAKAGHTLGHGNEHCFSFALDNSDYRKILDFPTDAAVLKSLPSTLFSLKVREIINAGTEPRTKFAIVRLSESYLEKLYRTALVASQNKDRNISSVEFKEHAMATGVGGLLGMYFLGVALPQVCSAIGGYLGYILSNNYTNDPEQKLKVQAMGTAAGAMIGYNASSAVGFFAGAYTGSKMYADSHPDQEHVEAPTR